MSTCDTCKWWGKGYDYETDNPPYKVCGHWIPTTYSSPEDGFGVVNGEPYNAGNFGTGPKFGCIHHEPK